MGHCRLQRLRNGVHICGWESWCKVCQITSPHDQQAEAIKNLACLGEVLHSFPNLNIKILWLPRNLLRLHALCVNLVAWLWRSVEANTRLLPNCLFGLYSANFPIGNADLRISGSTRLHNTVRRSLVSHHISCLLRVHTTPLYYILCIYIAFIVCMNLHYCMC